MILWTPTSLQLEKAFDYAERYIAKEEALGNNAHGGVEHSLIGKLAEEAWLTITGGIVDYDVVLKRGKHEPDIQNPTQLFSGKRPHVKTAFRATSWTAGKNDAIVVDPAENDLLLLAFANTDYTINMWGYVPARAVQNIWTLCDNEDMGHKRAISLYSVRDRAFVLPD